MHCTLNAWLLVVSSSACFFYSSGEPTDSQGCTSTSCLHPGSEDSALPDSMLSMLQTGAKTRASQVRAAAHHTNSANASWKVISPMSACEKNDQGIAPLTSGKGFTLETCKTKCLQAGNCAAVDFFQKSGWCHTYDLPCSKPGMQKDGASSHRLQVGHSFGEVLMQTSSTQTAQNWVPISESAACEENEQGIPPLFHKAGFTLETCKAKCIDTEKCRAIDFYSQSTWCLLYDEPCKDPKVTNDGAASYRLLIDEHRVTKSALQTGTSVGLPTETSSVREVEQFMKDMGQPEAGSQMKDEMVDGEAFLMLKQEDLKDYGMKKGPILKLSKHIEEARNGEALSAVQSESELHEVVGANGVLMISLESRPERFQYAADQLGRVGIKPTRFAAVDASREPKEKLELACPSQDAEGVTEWCQRHHKSGSGCGTGAQQAISMSHYEALKAARARDWEWTAIFEDDAVPTPVENWNDAFRQAWEQVPPHVKFVRLGWCHMGLKGYPAPVVQRYYANVSEAFLAQDTGFTLVNSNTSRAHYHYEPGGCTTAYMVHQDIISDLLSLFPCCGPVDSCYKWDFLKVPDPATGIEKGLTIMMDIDTYFQPSGDGNIDHHGLILQDRDTLPSSQD